ncbi:hypothetical protein AUR04nite_22840 [Glutamicibacter uratoxydans]|uniref:N-acetyltransferase domain-containing protein n=2 Tax=Glutamicibacter uratoxydans TaxID=43667 RepID=A0A4Y4DN70_GLUUR|nr:hypothetical protein AUR04nite_22840 [Glutamicibacter uratoxydans]
MPSSADLEELFALCSDERLWAHRPSSRHQSPEQTKTMMDAWCNSWDECGLGTWVIRAREGEKLIGYGGCSLIGGSYWNLGYRFAVASQGQGFATEIARAAVERAREKLPAVPVAASILEHNPASSAVAQKLGFTLAYRGLDEGNPDPKAIRLIYADRALSFEQIAQIAAPSH